MVAGRSYPKPEARGGDLEELPQPLRPRPGVAAGRSYPTPEARGVAGRTNPRPRSGGCVGAEGLEELSHVEGQEERW